MTEQERKALSEAMDAAYGVIESLVTIVDDLDDRVKALSKRLNRLDGQSTGRDA